MIEVIDLGLIDFESAYLKQKEFLFQRKKSLIEDILLICEHESIYTIGRSGNKGETIAERNNNLENGIKIRKIDRGGDITFHGKGQIVIYPIIDLRDYGKDVHKYLEALEDVAKKFLKKYHLEGESKSGFRGVWIGDKKIASIGIGVSNWFTYHGMSINIKPDLRNFEIIDPCGIKGCKMTSVERVLGKDIDIKEAKENLIVSFEEIFSSMRIPCEKLASLA